MSTRSRPTARVYAALLTAQGKYLHDFIMVEAGEAIWLDAEAARLADLKRRLSMYRLRAKVAIDERPELAVAAVFGDGGARARSACRASPGRRGRSAAGVAFVDPRLAALGAACHPAARERSRGARRAGLAEAGFRRL